MIPGKPTLSKEQQKKLVGEQLWLLYYNQYLYDHGVITELERNRMKNKITARGLIPYGKGAGR